MARSVGKGRPIALPSGAPSYQLPKELVPQELMFFSPPKGIDVVTPLAKLPREYSPEINNLILDKGILRSRYGVEKYHDKDGALQLQRTTDLGGTASQTAPETTARSTAAQGAAAGWTDPDGANDGYNIITTGSQGTTTITAA